MPHYFLLLDANVFHDVAAALTVSWRRRSFAPCAALCERLVPAARAFAERFHTGPDEPLLAVAHGLAFDRGLWRSLAGEMLWYSATDIPTVRTAPDTLCCILAPGHHGDEVPRAEFVPIQQVHQGTRDLVFGGATYRPDHAGYNNADDVPRLARYLQGVDPATWTGADLEEVPDLDEADREEELEFARQRFAELREVYAPAAAAGQVIVCEVI